MPPATESEDELLVSDDELLASLEPGSFAVFYRRHVVRSRATPHAGGQVTGTATARSRTATSCDGPEPSTSRSSPRAR